MPLLYNSAAILVSLQHLIPFPSHALSLWSHLNPYIHVLWGFLYHSGNVLKVEAEEIQLSPPPFPQVHFPPIATWNWTPQPTSRGGKMQGLCSPLEDLTAQSETDMHTQHKAGKERIRRNHQPLTFMGCTQRPLYQPQSHC